MLHIDRLVVRGMARADAEAITAALQTELGRAWGGGAPLPAAGEATAPLRARAAAPGDGGAVGRAVAGCVVRERGRDWAPRARRHHAAQGVVRRRAAAATAVRLRQRRRPERPLLHLRGRATARPATQAVGQRAGRRLRARSRPGRRPGHAQARGAAGADAPGRDAGPAPGRGPGEAPDPVGEGLGIVAENLSENNPAFGEFTDRLAERFLSQPPALSVGVPVFLGANYAFLWGLALVNPAMRRQLRRLQPRLAAGHRAAVPGQDLHLPDPGPAADAVRVRRRARRLGADRGLQRRRAEHPGLVAVVREQRPARHRGAAPRCRCRPCR